jgi:hypothetical protein
MGVVGLLAQMEQGFGHGFDGGRIHTDERASQLTKQRGAVGPDRGIG